MSDTRSQIYGHIESQAGIHFNELVRESAFAPGQIQYHCRRLINDGDVVREEFYGQTHYYPPVYDDWQRGVLALLRRETAREIVVYVIEHDTVRPDTITAELDIARSTLEYHLNHLIEYDIVTKQYDRNNRVLLTVPSPEEIAPLMADVSPTVPDRLVDRFTRLVDHLLDGN